MERPTWIPPPVWRPMREALALQPEHASDTLADLAAVTATWDERRRSWLIARVAALGLAGTPLPAALMLSLAEALDE